MPLKKCEWNKAGNKEKRSSLKKLENFKFFFFDLIVASAYQNLIDLSLQIYQLL